MVAKMNDVIKRYVDRFGWGEMLEVADELGLATDGAEHFGVWWEQTGEAIQEGRLHIEVSDLQLIALGAALAANGIVIRRFHGETI